MGINAVHTDEMLLIGWEALRAGNMVEEGFDVRFEDSHLARCNETVNLHIAVEPDKQFPVVALHVDNTLRVADGIDTA